MAISRMLFRIHNLKEYSSIYFCWINPSFKNNRDLESICIVYWTNFMWNKGTKRQFSFMFWFNIYKITTTPGRCCSILFYDLGEKVSYFDKSNLTHAGTKTPTLTDLAYDESKQVFPPKVIPFLKHVNYYSTGQRHAREFPIWILKYSVELQCYDVVGMSHVLFDKKY